MIDAQLGWHRLAFITICQPKHFFVFFHNEAYTCQLNIHF